ncbi:MAG: ADP-ribosylglycohydrolase family protein [Hormoscilla sp. GM102CHS1]|nr:ADP-ribosylglycohydrolase family protein [Hormoscilla sp. GM102CHS1]
MKKLLEQCQQGMKQGALPVDREVLAELGCFSSHKGAGTVSAAAAIFLASRYAADPINGLKFPAFAFGADTDTIASMTGGILGALHGIEWLGDYAEQVQDARYIRELAENLVKNKGAGQAQLAIETRKKHLDSFLEKLAMSNNGDLVVIPDGRKASTSDRQQHRPLSKTTVANYWKVRTVDGQTLYITKLSRQKNEMQNENHSQGVSEVRDEIDIQPVKVCQMTVKLLVVNLEKAGYFYERVLGLKVEKESKGLVRCDRIVLKQLNNLKSSEVPSNTSERNATICLEIKSLEPAYNNAVQFEVKILQQISSIQGRRFFRCLDPDGNPVEIYQAEMDF